MLNPDELAEVITGCRRQDRHGQFLLYQAFRGWVHSLCRRYNASEEAANECLQQVFLKVFTKIHQFGGEQSFEAWLKRITINTCIDAYRAQLRLPSTEDIELAADQSSLPDVLLDADAEYLLDLIRQLPVAYRTSFSLFAIDGYEYQEIADMLSIHIGTVKSNIFKARKALKIKLLKETSKENYGK